MDSALLRGGQGACSPLFAVKRNIHVCPLQSKGKQSENFKIFHSQVVWREAPPCVSVLPGLLSLALYGSELCACPRLVRECVETSLDTRVPKCLWEPVPLGVRTRPP